MSGWWRTLVRHYPAAASVRSYKLEGDRLTLTTQPSNDPASGKTTVRTVLWERYK